MLGRESAASTARIAYAKALGWKGTWNVCGSVLVLPSVWFLTQLLLGLAFPWEPRVAGSHL